MSRAYNFLVECYPVNTPEEAEPITQALESEMGCTVIASVEYTQREPDGLSTFFESSDASLCCGELDQEAHDRIVGFLKEKFPHLKTINTKWLCVEYQEWDSEYHWSEDGH